VRNECTPYDDAHRTAHRDRGGAGAGEGREAAKAWYLRQAEFLAFPEDGRVLWLPEEIVVGGV
jgi:hypothetical protein